MTDATGAALAGSPDDYRPLSLLRLVLPDVWAELYGPDSPFRTALRADPARLGVLRVFGPKVIPDAPSADGALQ